MPGPKAEALLFRRLLDNGVVVVAAMGNEYERGNETSYPAAYDDVISVGAVAEIRERSPFSNTGGQGIRAPHREGLRHVGRHVDDHPHVTAAAALILSSNPDLSPAEVRDRLRATARELVKLQAKFKEDAPPAERERVIGKPNAEGASAVRPLFSDSDDRELGSLYVVEHSADAVEFAEPEVRRKLVRKS